MSQRRKWWRETTRLLASFVVWVYFSAMLDWLRRRIKAILPVSAVLVVAIVCIGCTSSSSGTPKSVPDQRGTGTPLGLGLKVQPGSRLLGMVFPSQWPQPGYEDHQAVFTVNGDPAAVLDGYETQMKREGLDVLWRTCGPFGMGDLVECEIRASKGPPLGGERSVYLELVAPPATDHTMTTTIFIRTSEREPSVTVTSTTLDEDASRVAKLPTTTPPPTTAPPFTDVFATVGSRNTKTASIPRVGQLIMPKSMDPGLGLRVVDGVRLLAPAAPLNGGSMGWVAVARVTGDPVAIRDGYFRAAGERVDELQMKTGRSGGKPVYYGSASAAGGAGLYTVTVPAGDGTWFMFINVNND